MSFISLIMKGKLRLIGVGIGHCTTDYSTGKLCEEAHVYFHHVEIETGLDYKYI